MNEREVETVNIEFAVFKLMNYMKVRDYKAKGKCRVNSSITSPFSMPMPQKTGQFFIFGSYIASFNNIYKTSMETFLFSLFTHIVNITFMFNRSFPSF